MKKRNAVISLIIMAALVAGLCYTAIVGLGADKSGSISKIHLGLDLAGGVSITYQAVGETAPSSEDMADTVYKLQKRVDQYSTEAQVYREGDDRVNIEIPGVSDANQILADLGRPGSLYFIRETDDDGNPNYGYMVTEEGSLGYGLTRTIEELDATGDIVLSGTDVANATAGYQSDSMNNRQIVVELVFTDEGGKKFAEATKRAYDQGETIGIYYDGGFISVPRVQSPITNGQAIITGEESIESAQNLASTIRIGGLKVELEELRSNVVGAQLGQTAIQTSLRAGIIGLALVMVFMIAIYFIPGLTASIALVIYTMLMIIILNAFDVTLTLPGIAGILLSIGMAVDANVIIFARIREELKTGASVQNATDTGYQKALSAIIDGNVTTLITAFVLMWLGTGSVKGFAQTLAIGILLSMLTALFITKFLMKIFYGIGFQDKKWYISSKALAEKKVEPIDFTGRKKIFFGISIAVILAGFIAMGVRGASGQGALNYSLDFVGGTSTDVTFNQDYSLTELEQQVVPVFESVTGDSNVQLQKVAGSNEVIIKTRTLELAERQELTQKLSEQFGIDESSIQAETISSTISSEMRRSTMIAVILALALVLLYIWLRFKDIRFGASSVIALAHDVLVTLTCYAILRVSVGSTFIACMLTIVGYSVNATIVIFDRIRENMQMRKPGEKMDELVNMSVTQTLSRSLFTSLTTFIMVFILYIFGVASIRVFALPIMVGIVAGAYSSVCISGSLWLVLRGWFPPKHDDSGARPKQNKQKAKTDEEKRRLQEKRVWDKTLV